jgi:hypothetical protein
MPTKLVNWILNIFSLHRSGGFHLGRFRLSGLRSDSFDEFICAIPASAGFLFCGWLGGHKNARRV